MKIDVGTYPDEPRSHVDWEVHINCQEEAQIFQALVELGQLNSGEIAHKTGLPQEGVDAVLGCFKAAADTTTQIVNEKLAAIALLPPEDPVQLEATSEDQV